MTSNHIENIVYKTVQNFCQQCLVYQVENLRSEKVKSPFGNAGQCKFANLHRRVKPASVPEEVDTFIQTYRYMF